jgi:cold shock CspA family protein
MGFNERNLTRNKSMSRAFGIVTYYNEKRGFGFLWDGDQKRHVWFHMREVAGVPKPEVNQQAYFDVIDDPKYPGSGRIQARNVSIKPNQVGLDTLASAQRIDVEGIKSFETKVGG